jgi:hypothetical protein
MKDLALPVPWLIIPCLQDRLENHLNLKAKFLGNLIRSGGTCFFSLGKRLSVQLVLYRKELPDVSNG